MNYHMSIRIKFHKSFLLQVDLTEMILKPCMFLHALKQLKDSEKAV